MTPEQLAEQMQQLVDGTHPSNKWGSWEDDPEVAHRRADHLLIATLRELGYEKAMDIYDDDNLTKWYS